MKWPFKLPFLPWEAEEVPGSQPGRAVRGQGRSARAAAARTSRRGAASWALLERAAPMPLGTGTAASVKRTSSAPGSRESQPDPFCDRENAPVVVLNQICSLRARGNWEPRGSMFIPWCCMGERSHVKPNPLPTQNYGFFYSSSLAMSIYSYIQMLIINVHWDYSLNVLIYIQA